MNPIQAYTMEGFELFEEFLTRIDNQIATFLLNAEIRQNIERNIFNSFIIIQIFNIHKFQIISFQIIISPCGSGKKYKNCCGRNQ